MKPSLDPRLVKGIDEFNRRLYFECHETLEEIWLEDHGEDRLFYQGLIQIAAGYYKLEQGVLIGAIKLWQRGLEKVEAYPPLHLGVDLRAMIATTRANLNLAAAAQARVENTVAAAIPVIAFDNREEQ